MVSELEQAYQHCRRVVKSSATNFYYAFRTLPADKRQAIYAVYAFARVCDDIADGDLSIDEKRRLLNQTRETFRLSLKGNVDDPVFLALADSIKKYSIPPEYFEEIIDGMEMDMTWTRFHDFDEVRVYCYKAASVVGLICI